MKSITVFVGPSGVGKTTICRAIAATLPECFEVVSTTTRDPRPGEENGVDYLFLDRETGYDSLARGEFLEHVIYDGNLYGFLHESFNREGRLVLVAERHGLEQLREAFGSLVQGVLVLPPSLEDLEERLRLGGRDEATIKRRLATAEKEIHSGLLTFDHVIMNFDLETSVALGSYMVDSFNP